MAAAAMTPMIRSSSRRSDQYRAAQQSLARNHLTKTLTAENKTQKQER
jgi:hypothetical protein